MSLGPPSSLRMGLKRASIMLASPYTTCGEFLTDASCHCSWGYKYAEAAMHDNHVAASTPSLSTWLSGLTISCRRSPAFSCRDFPSHASRRASCRCASGLADAVKLSPCPICLPLLPWRYALGGVSLLPECWASPPGATSVQSAKAHQHRSPLHVQCYQLPSSAFLRATIRQILSP